MKSNKIFQEFEQLAESLDVRIIQEKGNGCSILGNKVVELIIGYGMEVNRSNLVFGMVFRLSISLIPLKRVLVLTLLRVFQKLGITNLLVNILVLGQYLK